MRGLLVCWRRLWHPTPVLLPGKSHGWRSLVGCGPWGREESDMTERLHFYVSLFTFTHWRRKWQPTPVFLPGESQGGESLVGCRLRGCRVGHDWSGLALAFSCVCAQSLQLCSTSCNPKDCSPWGSSVHGILQERILQWVAMPSSRGSSWPRD